MYSRKHLLAYYEFVLPVLLLLAFVSPAHADDMPAFPLKVSSSGRYLVDQKGTPFFYQADTPWMIFYDLTTQEAEEYFADRKAHGFTAAQIMLTGFYDKKTRDGRRPFVDDDLAKPDEAFFAHVDEVIQKATDQGLFLAIAPLWSGCCGEGWAGEKDGKKKPLDLNGPDKAQQFGQWLGKRYGKFQNIMWIMGGDHDPGSSREAIRRMAVGLHETAPHQLMTVHNAPEHSSREFFGEEPWLSINAAYSYREVAIEVSEEFEHWPIRPIFLIESGYENEANDKRPGMPFRIRRQAWGAILSGALMGEAYGHRDIWPMKPRWREALNDPGSRQLEHVTSFMKSVRWYELTPDFGTSFIKAGRGELGKDDYITVAKTDDGTRAVIYLPIERAIAVDLGRMSSVPNGTWYDPTSGSRRPVNPASLRSRGVSRIDSPGKNAAGEFDWVLLLEAK